MEKMQADYEYLEKFTEEEMKLACDFCLEGAINGINHNKKLYKSSLQKINGGNLDKRSKVVRAQLPDLIIRQHKKNDEFCDRIIEQCLKDMGALYIEEKKQAGFEDLDTLTDDEYAALYVQIKGRESTFSHKHFFLMIKITDTEIDQKRIDAIGRAIEDSRRKQEEMLARVKEIETEKKKTADELSQQFSKEKKKYEKTIDEKNRTIKELQESCESLQKRLDQELKAKDSERTSLVEQWKREYEAELSRVDADVNKYRKDKLREVDAEVGRLKDEKTASVMKVIAHEHEIEERKNQSLREENTSLESERERLEADINELQKKHEDEEKRIKQYELYEESFFSEIEKRMYERKLEDVALSIRGENPPGANSTDAFGKYCIFESESIEVDNVEYRINGIEDLLEDLNDNMSLSFERQKSMEISAIILSAFIERVPIILEKSIVNEVVDDLTGLLTQKTAPTVRVYGDCNPFEIVDEINKSDSPFLIVDGVLDRFDELLAYDIVHRCYDKFFVFTISDIEDVKRMSKTIHNEFVPLDIDRYSIYVTGRKLLGHSMVDLNIHNLLDTDSQENKYDETFSKLVNRGIISPSKAKTYTRLINAYNQLISGEDICEILCESMISGEKVNDPQVRESLIRAGILKED